MTLVPDTTLVVQAASLESRLIQRTLRVPAVEAESGDSHVVVRQLDAALLTTGFKLSGELAAHLAAQDEGAVLSVATTVLSAARRLVGAYVQYNVYFRDFPDGVPDTVDFWVRCVRDALADPRVAEEVYLQTIVGEINLLDLPSYGRYQHSYEEMVAAHAGLIRSLGDRVTVLHLGGSLEEELQALYLSLATSSVPLSEVDRDLLVELAARCAEGAQPEVIPVRESRALVNAVRLTAGRSLLSMDTVTDVLRLACAVSDGDVTLSEPTRFRSFRRPERRVLLTALHEIVVSSPTKLADVRRYGERWKRLGERLHPHEYTALSGAAMVFATARGERTVRSHAARVELALASGAFDVAVSLLAQAPGMLVRSLDRLLRSVPVGDVDLVVEALRAAAPRVSGRVLLSLVEHLCNRDLPDVARVFTNQRGRAWVTADTREPLGADVVDQVVEVLDAELLARLPSVGYLVVDPEARSLALPLSGKAVPEGLAVMPRGSVTAVEGDSLRFFVYWQEAAQRTDFDLSVLLLDEDFQPAGYLSWTALSRYGGVHSGDIVESRDGASEFIDLNLRQLPSAVRYIVPQVNIYRGEGFDEVTESMFGFMTRDSAQQGLPFEPRTVRTRSEMRGAGRVALPLAFVRTDDGRWAAKWLHLTMRGMSWANRVETNRLSTALLARAILERRYLPVAYLVTLWACKAACCSTHAPGTEWPESATFVGLERPEGAPESAVVVSPVSLVDLVGANRA